MGWSCLPVVRVGLCCAAAVAACGDDDRPRYGAPLVVDEMTRSSASGVLAAARLLPTLVSDPVNDSALANIAEVSWPLTWLVSAKLPVVATAPSPAALLPAPLPAEPCYTSVPGLITYTKCSYGPDIHVSAVTGTLRYGDGAYDLEVDVSPGAHEAGSLRVGATKVTGTLVLSSTSGPGSSTTVEYDVTVAEGQPVGGSLEIHASGWQACIACEGREADVWVKATFAADGSVTLY